MINDKVEDWHKNFLCRERSNLCSWSTNFDCLFLRIVFHCKMKLVPPLHDARTIFRSGMKFQSGMRTGMNSLQKS